MARSAVNYIYDSDLSFRDPSAVAITANGATLVGAIPLDKLDKARGDQRDKLGAQAYALVIAVSASDTLDGDETYVFTVQIGATGAAAQLVATIPVTGALGQYVILLDAETLEKQDADHAEIELNLTIDDGAANTASITFGAWLALHA
jgi:hypothetical protein